MCVVLLLHLHHFHNFKDRAVPDGLTTAFVHFRALINVLLCTTIPLYIHVSAIFMRMISQVTPKNTNAPHTVHKNNSDSCSISEYVLTSFLPSSLFTSIWEILILFSTLKVGVRMNHSRTACPRWNTD